MKKNELLKYAWILSLFLMRAVTASAEQDVAQIKTIPPLEGGGIALEDAIERALNFNPDFRALRKNVDIARAEITRANTFTNPEAGLNIEKGNEPDLRLEFELDKQMRVGSWWFNRKAAKAGFEAAKEGLRAAEQSLIREVKSVFYSLLSLERILHLQEETVRLNDELAKVARSRFTRGEVSEVEVNIFEVERDSSIQEKKRLEAAYLDALFRFKNLLGFTPEMDIKPKGELFDRGLKLDIQSLLFFALEHRPDLLRAQHRVKQAKHLSTLAKVEAIPPITLGFRYEQEPIENDVEKFYGARIAIGVPVFDQNRARIQETKALRQQAEDELQATLIRVQREIQTAFNNLKLIKERLDLYEQEMKPKLEKTLTVYKAAYQEGRVNLFEILINERQYFQVKTNYLNTLNEYDQAIAELDRVLGGKPGEIIQEGGMGK